MASTWHTLDRRGLWETSARIDLVPAERLGAVKVYAGIDQLTAEKLWLRQTVRVLATSGRPRRF